MNICYLFSYANHEPQHETGPSQTFSLCFLKRHVERKELRRGVRFDREVEYFFLGFLQFRSLVRNVVKKTGCKTSGARQNRQKTITGSSFRDARGLLTVAGRREERSRGARNEERKGRRGRAERIKTSGS